MGCDKKSILSTTDLNSVFISKTGCLTKTKKPSQPYYLPIAGGEKR